jgi:DNA-binding MarR family transcriptional regulator
MDMSASFASTTIEYTRKYTPITMSSQVLREQTSAVRAFVALVRAHATATRQLNAQLLQDHGLTINDYEVLLRLSRAPDSRMRRVDLAEQVLLTASGITRLLDGLERCGYVERASCASDRRVVYAVLTASGRDKLREASKSHIAQIEELFSARLDESQQDAFASMLERVAAGDADLDCAPPEE